jgi:hypothetical protein
MIHEEAVVEMTKTEKLATRLKGRVLFSGTVFFNQDIKSAGKR